MLTPAGSLPSIRREIRRFAASIICNAPGPLPVWRHGPCRFVQLRKESSSSSRLLGKHRFKTFYSDLKSDFLFQPSTDKPIEIEPADPCLQPQGRFAGKSGNSWLQYLCHVPLPGPPRARDVCLAGKLDTKTRIPFAARVESP